jgi:hypothetical protein
MSPLSPLSSPFPGSLDGFRPPTAARRLLALVFLAWSAAALAACDGPAGAPAGGAADALGGPDAAAGKADRAGYTRETNYAAGTMVLYELQVRAANACDPRVGSTAQRVACEEKIAPEIPYRAEGLTCDSEADLARIRLGTFEDLRVDTADFREGITLRYVAETVGANTLWLMPIFPNNDTWSIPSACDDVGSPYAVRDYLHPRGTLSQACILEGRDEYSDEPCWGTESFDELIADAHARGLRVMLDVAFNHFGHNYLPYDVQTFRPVRDRIAAGEDLGELWRFAATEDEALLYPELLDDPGDLERLAQRDAGHAERLAGLKQRCPELAGQRLVRAYHMWRMALDHERARFDCAAEYLEQGLPGFYLGSDQWNPSTGAGKFFTNEWRDVKFLFHHATNGAHAHEYVRNREYLFRVLNYWVSRGVDGFRLDHTTELTNGLAAEEWAYILQKVDYYAQRRGQARPVYLAEEFMSQQQMSRVVDVLTEGYVHDICGRGGVTKDAGHVEWVLSNMDRFQGRAYVMTALETHDEHRLLDGAGFDAWTGAGFWAVGAATWSTPMIVMGQELGESWGLAFRRRDFLRARFEGSGHDRDDADALVGFYRDVIAARLADENRALYSAGRAFLRPRSGQAAGPDPRLLAMLKWSDDGNVVLALHNLWRQDVTQAYYIDADVARAAAIRPELDYRLVDVFTGEPTSACRSGADLAWDLYVALDAETRLQWLRLERCE